VPEPERDPLRALADAWAKVFPPAAERELAELPEFDEGTRRAVEHLRRAWESLEAPASVGAAPLRARPAPRSFVPVAAAALLLALLGAAAWLGWTAAAARTPQPTVARGGGPPRPVTRGGGLPPVELPCGAAAGVVAVTSERIEMRAGNVRLVLLTGGAPGADLDSDTERTH